MKIIDFHTHLPWKNIYPKAFIQESINELVGDSHQNSELKSIMNTLYNNGFNDKYGDKFTKELDDANIEDAVLLIADFGYSMGESELTIREIFDHHQNIANSRLSFFGGIDPRRGKEGYDLFEEYAKKGIMKGLKLYPPCGFELTDNLVMPLLEICDAYSLNVLTHTGPSLNSMRTEKLYPQSIINIATNFKKLKFIAAHGIRNMKHTEEILKKTNNIFIDISGFHLIQKEELESRFKMLEAFASDRILFGSDWPMFKLGTTLKNIVDSFLELHLNDNFKIKILHENAIQLKN